MGVDSRNHEIAPGLPAGWTHLEHLLELILERLHLPEHLPADPAIARYGRWLARAIGLGRRAMGEGRRRAERLRREALCEEVCVPPGVGRLGIRDQESWIGDQG